MVGENDCQERRTMKIMAPGFKSLDNAEKFSVINFIVPFSRVKRVRDITTGMPVAVHVLLLENFPSRPF